jgi:AraC-like DNA-binding protein
VTAQAFLGNDRQNLPAEIDRLRVKPQRATKYRPTNLHDFYSVLPLPLLTMDGDVKKLYYPIVMAQSIHSKFPVSLYATTHAAYQDVFYTVPRAGHMLSGPDHSIRRNHFPGHEVILCLRGSGFVRIHGTTHSVSAGEMVWINCHHPHEHGAIATDPWEVLWVRMEGPRLEQMCAILSLETEPIFRGVDVHEATVIYREIFRLMELGAEESAPLLHAALAQLIALVFRTRHGQHAQNPVPAPLRKAIERMKLFYFEPLTVADLSAHVGMSTSHFARTFKNTFGTSPIDWLRQERISQAKRRLGDTTDPIQQIAELVGYRDRFFFSKDFKRMTGYTPREFRRREAS